MGKPFPAVLVVKKGGQRTAQVFAIIFYLFARLGLSMKKANVKKEPG
jgi:hypothetical protein